MRALLLTAGLMSLAATAEAGVADDGVIIAAATLGTLGGVANTISALVYSLDERSFDTPWLVSSMFTSAICGSMTVSFIVELAGTGDVGWLIIALFTGSITAIPTYWTIKSAVSEADPGERFDAPLLEASTQRPMTIDPMSQLSPRAIRPATIVPIGVTF